MISYEDVDGITPIAGSVGSELGFDSMWRLRRVTVAACLALSTLPSAAAAAPPDANAHAVAVKHFEAGRALFKSGRCDLAIAEFRASIEAEPNVGPWLNLGECLEAGGLVQDAYDSYRSAQSVATQKGDWRLADAERRVAALEAKSVRFSVTAPTDIEIQLEIDNAAVPRRRWPHLVVSPGISHQVVARSDRGEFTRTVRGQAGDVLPQIEIAFAEHGTGSPPAAPTMASLANASVVTESTAPPPNARTQSGGRTQRTIGFVVGGVGLGALAAGAVFGVLHLSAESDHEAARRQNCMGNVCDELSRGTILSLRDTSIEHRTASTLFFVSGAVLTLGGVALVLLARSPSSAAARAATALLRGQTAW